LKPRGYYGKLLRLFVYGKNWVEKEETSLPRATWSGPSWADERRVLNDREPFALDRVGTAK